MGKLILHFFSSIHSNMVFVPDSWDSETPKSAAVAIASALIQARVRQPNGGDDDDDDDDNDGIFVAPSTTSSRRASNSSNASTTNTGATSTHVHGSSSNSHQSSASASSSLSSMSPRPLSSSHALSLSSTSSLSNSSSQSHLSDIANRQSRSNSGNTSHISHSHHSSNDPFSLPSGPRSQSNSFSMEFALSSSTPLPQFHRLQLSSPSSTSSNSSLHSFFPPGTNSPGLGSGRQSPSTSFSVASSFSPSASTGTPSPSLPHSSHLPALPSPSSYSSSSSSSSSPFASNSLLAAASPSFSPSSSLSPYPPLPPPSSSSSSSAASASSSSTSSFVSPFAQSPSPSAAKIADWASLNHVELIHRQGLQAPPIVFQITEDPTDEVCVCAHVCFTLYVCLCLCGRMYACLLFVHSRFSYSHYIKQLFGLSTQANRMFYQLFLPQANPEQQESSLCCRKKSKENKFRFRSVCSFCHQLFGFTVFVAVFRYCPSHSLISIIVCLFVIYIHNIICFLPLLLPLDSFISLDAIKMTKRDNPGYVGKMKCNDAFDTFTVTLASGVHLVWHPLFPFPLVVVVVDGIRILSWPNFK